MLDSPTPGLCNCKVRGNEKIEFCPPHAAMSEMVDALKDFVDYAQCRAANTKERKMHSDRFAYLGNKYRALLKKVTGHA